MEGNKDEVDFTYLKSLSIYLVDIEHQWGEVFRLADLRKAFQTGYWASDRTGVARVL